MKTKIFITLLSSLFAAVTYSQQNFCADSSFRIKYIFGNDGATLYNNPDTLGKNIFTGRFLIGNQTNAIALLKTTWGDSMVWAKKIYAIGGINISSFNSVTAPDGSIVCTGDWGNLLNGGEFLICKIDTNSNVQWIKRFKASQNHVKYNGVGIQNIAIANNSIYFNAIFGNGYSTIAKLDLNGNIIWSRGLGVNLPNYAGYQGAPIYFNNTVLMLNMNLFMTYFLRQV